MPLFLHWLSDHGVDTSVVAIEQFAEAGYGLKAVRDIQVCTVISAVTVLKLKPKPQF